MARNTAVATKPVDKAEIVKSRLAQATAEMTNPTKTAEEIAYDILQANTLEEILGSTVLHMEDLEGQSFMVKGASLTASDYKEGLGAYAVIDAVMGNGERAVIISGATNVVAQLIAMHAKKFYPAWVQFKSAQTGSGFTAWRLVKGSGEQPTVEQLAAWSEDF